MTGVKVIDKDPGAPRRRQKLWECFGAVNLHPTDIKDGRGAYYAILKNEQLEQMLNEQTKQTFLR